MTNSSDFDPSSFRRSQNFAALVPTKKVHTKIPVRKPAKEWFIRTHPNSDYWFPTQVIDLKEENDIYLVHLDLVDSLQEEPTFRSKLLVPAITRQGVVFLWPIGLPDPEGRLDNWNASARDAADQAKDQWVRVTSNCDIGAYEIIVATGTFPEPEFPEDFTFEKMMSLAFDGKIIKDLNHIVLRKLRGEI